MFLNKFTKLFWFWREKNGYESNVASTEFWFLRVSAKILVWNLEEKISGEFELLREEGTLHLAREEKIEGEQFCWAVD